LPWPHLTNSVRSLIAHLDAVDTIARIAHEQTVSTVSMEESTAAEAPPAPPVLAISGVDIRQALEVSTAAYQSAMRGGVPMALPLEDRVGSPVYPRGYRWGGGDSVGSVQSSTAVLENGGRTWEGLSTGYS
jgi:hypothetical protein